MLLASSSWSSFYSVNLKYQGDACTSPADGDALTVSTTHSGQFNGRWRSGPIHMKRAAMTTVVCTALEPRNSRARASVFSVAAQQCQCMG